MGQMKGFSNVLNDETLNHLKMARIVRQDLVARMQRRNADLKVCKRDGDARFPSFRVKPCRQLAHFPGKWLYGHCGEDLSQVQLPLRRALGRVCSPYSMAKFNHADRGYYDLTRSGDESNLPEKFADRLRATLGGYQHA
jgi:hypothetical protein